MSKQQEANVKKLVQLGYSKSKAQKALKDCANNFQNAKLYLERDAKEKEEQLKKVELEKLAEQKAREAKSFTIHSSKEVGVVEEKVETTQHRGKGANRKHPCFVQYGSCRYGARCAFRNMPGDTCINYVLGNCIYEGSCKNFHPPDIETLRKEAFGETLQGDDEYFEEEEEEEASAGDNHQPRYIPDASSWVSYQGTRPTHSDPVANTTPSWNQNQTASQQSSGSAAPQPFLEKLAANTDPNKKAGGSAVHHSKVVTAPMSKKEKEELAAAKKKLHPCVAQMGACKYGDSCLHAHKPADICVHFLNGRCKFGDDCTYRHVDDGLTIGGGTTPSPNTPPGAVANPVAPMQPPPPFSAKHTSKAPPSPPFGANFQQGVPPASNFLGKSAAAPPAMFSPSPSAGAHRGPHQAPQAGSKDDGSTFWSSNSTGIEYTASGAPSQSAKAMMKAAPSMRTEYGNNSGPRDTSSPPSSPPFSGQNVTPAQHQGGGRPLVGMGANPAAARFMPSGVVKPRLGAQVQNVPSPFGGPTSPVSTPFGVVQTSSAPGGKRKTPPPQGGKRTPPPSTSTTAAKSDAIEEGSLEEERAFVAVKGAFPDTEPATILHYLRLHNYDRQKVADAILMNGTRSEMDIESTLSETESHDTLSEASGPGGAMTTVPLLSPKELKHQQEAAELATLCSLFPHMDKKTVAHFYNSERKNFAAAVEEISCSREHMQKTSVRNRWANPEGAPNQGEKLKVERLEAMFPGLPKQTVYHAFIETKKVLPKAIDILSQVLRDSEEELDARVEAGNVAMTSKLDVAGTRTQRVRATEDGDDDEDDLSQYTKKPLDGISSSSLYKEVESEISTCSDWRMVREQAKCVNDARLQLLDMAVVAYNTGNGKGAKSLSQDAKRLGREYRRLNILAMQSLERERATNGTGLSVLDLHGFYVEEAIDIVVRRLKMLRAKGVPKLRVITGAGNHSLGAKAILFPQLLEALKADGSQLKELCRVISARNGKIDLKVGQAGIHF